MPEAPPYREPFRTAVLGTVFGDRTAVVHRLRAGDRLILVPDPPGTEIPAVWVHAPGGDVLGHLSLQIAVWLAPWMLAGGRAGAVVDKVHPDEVESWQRLIIRVELRATGDAR